VDVPFGRETKLLKRIFNIVGQIVVQAFRPVVAFARQYQLSSSKRQRELQGKTYRALTKMIAFLFAKSGADSLSSSTVLIVNNGSVARRGGVTTRRRQSADNIWS
jgi:hypothetical protein